MSELLSKVEPHTRRPSPRLLRYFTALAAAGAAYPGVALWLVVPSILDPSSLLPAGVISSATACFLGAFVVLGWYAYSKRARTPLEPVHYFTAASGLIGAFSLVVISYAPELVRQLGTSWSVTRLFFIGPGTAIPLCQLAAAWSQCPANVWRRVRRRWRFQIRHVLLATAGIDLGLAILKLCGWLSPEMSFWIVVVAIYQWATLRLVLWFFTWRSPCEIEVGGGNGE